MMDITQEEVISQFELLLQQPVDEVAQEAAELKAHFYRLHNALGAEQRQKFEDDGGNPAEFIADTNPLEVRFKELFSRYKDSRAKAAQRRVEAEKKNLAEKKAIIEELKELIDNEERIGKSYERFKDLQDRWTAVGPVPASALSDLRAAYKSEVDRFYYNIKINKELKEYDLGKNLDMRTKLVAKLEELSNESKIKDVEFILQAAKEEWEDAGPVRKEDYPELRERYYSALKTLHKKIQDHYAELKDGMASNLKAKQDMVDEVLAMKDECGDSLQKFNNATQRISVLKEKWKKVGPVDRKHHGKIWAAFKEAQDEFFAAKKALVGEARETFKENRAAKNALIEKAVALQDSSDWKETTESLKRLQQQWKKAGSAGHRDEQKLWNTFREACDHFFNRKKEFFDTLDDRQADNLKAKKAMLKEMADTKLEGDKEQMRAVIKVLIDQWAAIGHVPKGDMDSTETAFKKALDKLYGQMDIDREQALNLRMKDRLERLSSDKDGSRQMEREMRQVQQQLKEKEAELFNYENNMAFFANSKGNNPLLAAAQKNIDNLKVEVDELRRKMRMFKQFA